MPFPVTISPYGNGIPVRPVETGAPVAIVAERGVPVVLSDTGSPLVIQGLAPPVDRIVTDLTVDGVGGEGVIVYEGTYEPEEAMPIVYVTAVLAGDDIVTEVADVVGEGEFSGTLEGLEPDTYSLRAVAAGGPTVSGPPVTVTIDTTGPAAVSRTLPPNGTYGIGQTLDFEITFNEVAIVTGAPRIEITLDSGTVYATYSGGSGNTTLLFSYTIEAGAEAESGVDVEAGVDLNGGTIKDSAGNDATYAALTAQSLPGVLVDGAAPPGPQTIEEYLVDQSLTRLADWDPATLAIANGQPVPSWPSRDSISATMANAAGNSTVPTMVASGIAGKPAVAFASASSQRMEATGAAPNFFNGKARPECTVIMVVEPLSEAGGGYWFVGPGSGNASQNSVRLGVTGSGPAFRSMLTDNTGSAGTADAGMPATSSRFVLVAAFNRAGDGKARIMINGATEVAQAGTTNLLTPPSNRMLLGSYMTSNTPSTFGNFRCYRATVVGAAMTEQQCAEVSAIALAQYS